jgi:hypothetical protein
MRKEILVDVVVSDLHRFPLQDDYHYTVFDNMDCQGGSKYLYENVSGNTTTMFIVIRAHVSPRQF